MRKICKYDSHHWLMQDKDKNLLLMNEQTNQIYDFQNFQPERSKREDLGNGLVYIEPNPEEMSLMVRLKYYHAQKALECGALNIGESQ